MIDIHAIVKEIHYLELPSAPQYYSFPNTRSHRTICKKNSSLLPAAAAGANYYYYCQKIGKHKAPILAKCCLDSKLINDRGGRFPIYIIEVSFQTVFTPSPAFEHYKDTRDLLDNIAMLTFLLVVGLGAGTLGSMLGVGGGIIMVPALTFLNVAPTQAASTSLIAVMSTSISSTIEYSRQNRINYGLSLEIAACAIPGGILGAVLSEYLAENTFKLYFGILLILTGLYILYRNSVLQDRHVKRRSLILQIAVFAASFGAGIISSLFGVGGGIIFVPAMLLVLGLTMQNAAPTSQLTLMMTAIAGVFTHSALGHPDYLHAIVLSVGAFIGAQIGARLSRIIKDVLLQRLLAVVLMAVAIVFILDGLNLRY